jgi:UDP-N-acetylmuramoyl-L-alanyl-D-glutamate--2,6-diaminopimelate ligase
VRFNTAAFTNLTRDHLDYHGTMETYGAAKARLFRVAGLAHRVINIDDAFGAALAAEPSPAQLTVTTRAAGAVRAPGAAHFVRAVRVTPEPTGLTIAVDSSFGQAELAVRLMGEFNADNSLTVLAVLLAWGVPLAAAVRALGRCRAASGRMEMFGGRGLTPLAIVDYAHTPDALEKALRAARLHCRGLLRVVFGCGGDRDAGKRPLMGQVAVRLADRVYVTDDNPRTEPPGQIRRAILAAAPNAIEIGDRREAIATAIADIGPGDLLVIAGKGHETGQIVGSETYPFDDAAIAREIAGSGPGNWVGRIR